MPVRLLEGLADLDGDLQRLIERQGTAAQPIGERLALEILEDQIVDRPS